MQEKVGSEFPFPLMSEIMNLEKILVSDEMMGKVHTQPLLAGRIRILMGLLDIAKKYVTIGRDKSAALVYGKAFALYKGYVKEYIDSSVH